MLSRSFLETFSLCRCSQPLNTWKSSKLASRSHKFKSAGRSNLLHGYSNLSRRTIDSLISIPDSAALVLDLLLVVAAETIVLLLLDSVGRFAARNFSGWEEEVIFVVAVLVFLALAAALVGVNSFLAHGDCDGLIGCLELPFGYWWLSPASGWVIEVRDWLRL